MTTSATMAGTANHVSGPSLFKLLNAIPEHQRFRHPADALVIIGRQLELVVQENGLAADLSIGTLRFSLFRMHQGRIAQLAPFCRSITVYGEADVEPPTMPGVEFVALPPGSALTQEWFVIIDSPAFWGALIAQLVPDRSSGSMRRYLFEGALTADTRVVSRANLLLSLTQRRPANEFGNRDSFANRACWARVAYNLAIHPEAERLGLQSAVNEFPELRELLAGREGQVEQLLTQAFGSLQRHNHAHGGLIFRGDGQSVQPFLSSAGALHHAPEEAKELAFQALTLVEPVLAPLAPNDPTNALFPGAHSLVTVPMFVRGQPWGALMMGMAETDPTESPTAEAVIGTAALLELLLADKADVANQPGPAAAPAMPNAYQNSTSSMPPMANGYQNGMPTAPPVPAYDPNPYAAPAPAVPPAYTPAPVAPAVPPAYAPAPAPAAPAAYTPAPAAPAPAPAAGGSFGLPAWMRGAAAPVPAGSAPVAPVANNLTATTEMRTDRSWAGLQKRLMGALVAFDQRAAEQVWSEACSMYPTEAICTELLMPVQIAVGEGWHRGEVSVAAEHFCSRYVEGKLLNLLNAYVDNPSGPLAVIGCAQAEMHELGAIMLSLFMRWSGFRVIYLGQNIPNSTIEETIRQVRPQVLGLSATTVEAAHNLVEVGHIINRVEPPRPLFIFGGMAFYERPDLKGRIRGQFLEGDVRQIVKQMAEQLRQR
ncbi:MAG: cobalamin-dependent protein [Chloroflexaceae bacterium]|jgi:methanogenic corrinoid protein MtbC1|nr:cobalamin-dependent protein [Chloroflexaceae bacterium]